MQRMTYNCGPIHGTSINRGTTSSMILFWFIAASMLIITVAVLLAAVLGIDVRHKLGFTKPDIDAPQQALNALQSRFDAGEIDEASFKAERAQIGEALINAVAAHERSSRDISPRQPGTLPSVIAIVVFVPALCIYLYFQLGSMHALTPQAVANETPTTGGQSPGSVEDMVDSLAARLKDNPDDAEGWIMLGRSYFVMERYVNAQEAYTRAHELLGEQPNVMVDLAEASALATGNRLEGEPERLINRALVLEPTNQKGLWLAGFAHLQRGENTQAVARWQTLRQMLPADSQQLGVIDDMIARAGGQSASTGETSEQQAQEMPADSPAIVVTVSLDPALAGKISGTETLFIFAKAVSGPPMPLAIQRTTANALPITVRLDDTMSMLPAFKLSGFEQVTVGARISLSGIATAQSGDLQGEVTPIVVEGVQETAVVISEVVP